MKYFFSLFILCLHLYLIAQPLKDSTFFLPQSYFASMGMQTHETNDLLRVYMNTKNKDASVSRVVDIRWVFNTAREAKKYFSENLQTESENGYEYKKEIEIPYAQNLKIYREDKAATFMYNASGIHNVHWYFIFLVDRVMIKIFTAGKFTQLNEVYPIALQAAKDVAIKLHLAPSEIKEMDLKNLCNTNFNKKVEEGKLNFHIPPGFDAGDASAISKHFDQEFTMPDEEYSIRYFIIPFDKNSFAEDTLIYKEYCKQKSVKYLSVALNIMMGKFGEMPPTKEIKEPSICKKKFNGDYFIESKFHIGKDSELSEDYKYCSMYAIFKKGAPDCYVFLLTNKETMFDLFSQVNFSTISYK